MKFDTAYYWQQGENATSLVLQQVYCKRIRETAVLACVCTEKGDRGKDKEGADFCRHFIDWFHGRGLSLCGRKRMDQDHLSWELCGIAEGQFSFGGIMCIGAQFVLFYRGRQKICLLNNRFSRPHISCLTDENAPYSEIRIKTGMLEKNIGLLLITDSFYETLTKDAILGCLGIDSVVNEKQAFRRLGELGEFGVRQGGRNMGAVLLVSR